MTGEPGPPVRVTAVTPAYNRARYLPACIESVLAQGFPGLEHVIVDDGSTDGTPEVVGPYLDRVRYERRENRGQSAAWNRCLELARGEYVAFLDSDDAWLPGKLARQIPMLDADPGAGMLYAAVRYIDADGNPSPVRPSRRPTPSGDILPELLLHNVMDTGGVIVRRRLLLEAGGFDPSIREGNDWDMWLRVALRHRVLFDPVPSALMRRHDDQMIADQGRMAEGLLRVMEGNLRRLEAGAPDRAPAARRAMARQYLRRARRLWGEGRAEEAEAKAARAVALDPSARLAALRARFAGWARRRAGRRDP
ncbi:MAG: glycosyltransferase [Planctomycetes bacterium]|nr:glycosyltransferase [Planctomycetota bacterium]